MYDFDSVIEQRFTCDEKHDQLFEYFGRDDLLPMWVAEMDFQTAPEILDDLHQRINHGIFGYSYRDLAYQQALVDWYQKHHYVSIDPSHIAYDTGVLKNIFELLRIFSEVGDEVCVPTPAYPQFEKVITRSKRKMKPFLLTNVEHRYAIDFDALATTLQTARVLLLCSPHNPGGRVWSWEELQQISKLCHQYQVLLICDEIHCDLTMHHQQFTSMLKVDPDCIILNSVSKPFNLAGLQHSYCICQNQEMNEKIQAHYVQNKIKSTNTLSMLAQRSAYTKGDAWLSKCIDYIYENDQFIRSFVKEHHLRIPIFTLEAGYLLWMDLSAYFKDGTKLEAFLIDTCKIATSFGRNFGSSYACFTRLNIATPRCNCEKAMEAIAKGLRQKGVH